MKNSLWSKRKTRAFLFGLSTLLTMGFEGKESLASDVPFMKTFGTSADDYARGLEQTSDGGFIVAGYTNGLGAGGQDILLIKFDVEGAVQWARTAGAAGSDKAFSVREAPDGGYIITGDTDSFTGMGQILTAKFDSSGNFLWAATVGTPLHSAAGLGLDVTSDGGPIVTGFPIGALGGVALLKYGSTGQAQWLRRAFGINHYGVSVRQTTDGGYVVAGSKQGNVYDLSLLKFSASGILEWAQIAGGNGLDQANSVRQTTDGGYIVAGGTSSLGAGGDDLLLLKYDGSGNLQWGRTVGGSGHDMAYSVEQTTDQGYIVVGHTGSFDKGGTVFFLLKFTTTGTLEWAKAGGGSASPSSVQQLDNGGYVMVGTTPGFGEGGTDVLLIRTDADGNISGCSNWSTVWPSVTAGFPSSATSHQVDSLGQDYSGQGILTVGNASLTARVQCLATVEVKIDVKPGSLPNSINLGSTGTVPVAIFSSTSFDATSVDPTATTLASAPVGMRGKGTPMCSVDDVDGDGLFDLVVHFSTEALQLSETDVQAVLEGRTFEGIRIKGVDTIRVVP